MNGEKHWLAFFALVFMALAIGCGWACFMGKFVWFK